MHAQVEKLARSLWDYDVAEGTTPEWRDMAWNDMGGSEKSEGRVEYELRAAHLIRTGAVPAEHETAARTLDNLADWRGLGRLHGIDRADLVSEGLRNIAFDVRVEGSLAAALR